MSFPCTSCGSCCRRIDQAVENMSAIDEDYIFPYRWDETGRCEMLTDDNLCKVYDNRPIICNIDLMILLMEMDKDFAYYETMIACNEMMDEDNVPLEKRINLL
jgi:Fe-S-cluster containining protein